MNILDIDTLLSEALKLNEAAEDNNEKDDAIDMDNVDMDDSANMEDSDDMEDSADIEDTTDIDDDVDMEDSDDEVMDLTNLSAESVMEILKKLPDDKQIKIVKTPTYNVTNESYDMNQDEDFEFDDMDEDWNVEAEYENYDGEADMNEYGYTQEMGEGEEGEFPPLGYDPTQTLTNPYNTPFNEAELDEYIKEAVQRFTHKHKKPNPTKLVAEEQSRIKIATLRNKMQQMQEAMRKMNDENKILKEHAQVLKKNLQEANEAVKFTVLQAKKIVYVKTLAEKYNLDKTNVAQVVAKFDQVKSLAECQKLFETAGKILKEFQEKVEKNKLQESTKDVKNAKAGNPITVDANANKKITQPMPTKGQVVEAAKTQVEVVKEIVAKNENVETTKNVAQSVKTPIKLTITESATSAKLSKLLGQSQNKVDSNK